jgi:hypothetical protein
MRQALSLAWESHGRVMLVCVMTEPNPSSSEIQQLLLDAIPPEANTWSDIDSVLKRGVPATEIVKVAERPDVDLLIIGPPRRWTSTTEAVLTDRSIPSTPRLATCLPKSNDHFRTPSQAACAVRCRAPSLNLSLGSQTPNGARIATDVH